MTHGGEARAVSVVTPINLAREGLHIRADRNQFDVMRLCELVSRRENSAEQIVIVQRHIQTVTQNQVLDAASVARRIPVVITENRVRGVDATGKERAGSTATALSRTP